MEPRLEDDYAPDFKRIKREPEDIPNETWFPATQVSDDYLVKVEVNVEEENESRRGVTTPCYENVPISRQLREGESSSFGNNHNQQFPQNGTNFLRKGLLGLLQPAGRHSITSSQQNGIMSNVQHHNFHSPQLPSLLGPFNGYVPEKRYHLMPTSSAYTAPNLVPPGVSQAPSQHMQPLGNSHSFPGQSGERYARQRLPENAQRPQNHPNTMPHLPAHLLSTPLPGNQERWRIPGQLQNGFSEQRINGVNLNSFPARPPSFTSAGGHQYSKFLNQPQSHNSVESTSMVNGALDTGVRSSTTFMRGPENPQGADQMQRQFSQPTYSGFLDLLNGCPSVQSMSSPLLENHKTWSHKEHDRLREPTTSNIKPSQLDSSLANSYLQVNGHKETKSQEFQETCHSTSEDVRLEENNPSVDNRSNGPKVSSGAVSLGKDSEKYERIILKDVIKDPNSGLGTLSMSDGILPFIRYYNDLYFRVPEFLEMVDMHEHISHNGYTAFDRKLMDQGITNVSSCYIFKGKQRVYLSAKAVLLLADHKNISRWPKILKLKKRLMNILYKQLCSSIANIPSERITTDGNDVDDDRESNNNAENSQRGNTATAEVMEQNDEDDSNSVEFIDESDFIMEPEDTDHSAGKTSDTSCPEKDCWYSSSDTEEYYETDQEKCNEKDAAVSNSDASIIGDSAVELSVPEVTLVQSVTPPKKSEKQELYSSCKRKNGLLDLGLMLRSKSTQEGTMILSSRSVGFLLHNDKFFFRLGDVLEITGIKKHIWKNGYVFLDRHISKSNLDPSDHFIYSGRRRHYISYKALITLRSGKLCESFRDLKKEIQRAMFEEMMSSIGRQYSRQSEPSNFKFKIKSPILQQEFQKVSVGNSTVEEHHVPENVSSEDRIQLQDPYKEEADYIPLMSKQKQLAQHLKETCQDVFGGNKKDFIHCLASLIKTSVAPEDSFHGFFDKNDVMLLLKNAKSSESEFSNLLEQIISEHDNC